MSLRDTSIAIGAVVRAKLPDATIEDRLAKLREEVTELHRAVLNGEGSVADELADVVIVCANVADFYHIDLDESIRMKLPQALAKLLAS